MQPLSPDTCFHIYNHANGFENVFKEAENYRFFLEKYQVYISPIAETYAYCLMPNHFHLVIRIRKREVIENLILIKNNTSAAPQNTFSYNAYYSSNAPIEERGLEIISEINSSKVPNFGRVHISNSSADERVHISNLPADERVNISNNEIEKYLSKQFSNFFSCYTQSFNKVYKRMGSLFIKNFKREPINDKSHFLNVIVYTHRNPIHHGFCHNFDDWAHSSYSRIVYGVGNIIETDKLLTMTGGIESFIEIHRGNLQRLESLSTFDISYTS